MTFNQMVVGSIPTPLTSEINAIGFQPPAGAHESAHVRREASGTADQLSTGLSSLFSTKATSVPTSAIDTYS